MFAYYLGIKLFINKVHLTGPITCLMCRHVNNFWRKRRERSSLNRFRRLVNM